MATAAVIDFGSFSSLSDAERVQSRVGIADRTERVRGLRVRPVLDGIRWESWDQARRCALSWIKFG